MNDSQRTIFHIDIDAFYASVEVRDNPSLKGKPLIVGFDPEGGRGGRVVGACSYEARSLGVRSRRAISRASRIAPDAVYVRPDYRKYSEASTRIMKLLRDHADELEQVGIDEAFLDVSSRVRGIDQAKSLALQIKREIASEGLTCSIGIAPNKSSAKIASDLLKPDGLTVVPPTLVTEFLAPLPVGVIPGVGKKTGDFLKERGIETISQLQSLPGKQLVRWFGKNGVWLWGVIHGTERIAVRPREPKSLNVEKTFRRDVKGYGTVMKEAELLAHELVRRLKRGNLQFRTVGVKIRFRGFETHTMEKTLPENTDDLDTMLTTVKSLLKNFEGRRGAVRLVGVRASHLRRKEDELSTLDSWA